MSLPRNPIVCHTVHCYFATADFPLYNGRLFLLLLLHLGFFPSHHHCSCRMFSSWALFQTATSNYVIWRSPGLSSPDKKFVNYWAPPTMFVSQKNILSKPISTSFYILDDGLFVMNEFILSAPEILHYEPITLSADIWYVPFIFPS